MTRALEADAFLSDSLRLLCWNINEVGSPSVAVTAGRVLWERKKRASVLRTLSLLRINTWGKWRSLNLLGAPYHGFRWTWRRTLVFVLNKSTVTDGHIAAETMVTNLNGWSLTYHNDDATELKTPTLHRLLTVRAILKTVAEALNGKGFNSKTLKDFVGSKKSLPVSAKKEVVRISAKVPPFCTYRRHITLWIYHRWKGHDGRRKNKSAC